MLKREKKKENKVENIPTYLKWQKENEKSNTGCKCCTQHNNNWN